MSKLTLKLLTAKDALSITKPIDPNQALDESLRWIGLVVRQAAERGKTSCSHVVDSDVNADVLEAILISQGYSVERTKYAFVISWASNV